MKKMSRFVARWVAIGLASVALGALPARPATAQKVILQGFWWDYWNASYPLRWADYLVALAPRLRAMGIDAVWIPPTTKGANQGVGYNPFDHYDLGDKYQKGAVRTRVGNKDEVLRLSGVLHANGIDVVQDIVLNHVIGAGSNTGAGGRDPAAWDDSSTDKYKNFRYACWATPATSQISASYLAQRGRWPKNWQNFNPNPGNNSTSGDWNQVMFGPDVSYYQGSYGLSSNAVYNPTQAQNHMRQGAREWLIWYKKQAGFDGVRLDAVKNFPDWAAEDFLYNLQNNAAFASGGNTMFAVGEYVGGASQLDGWCNAVQNRAGTFDFGLRGAINSMVKGNGNYDLGGVAGSQQQNRVQNYNGTYVHRTVPFVNNHDTFRPIPLANGNYDTWDSGNELGGGHIDPRDSRLSPAYAIALAVDGSPQIFFEDLFDVGTTGQRFSHQPENPAQLPIRDDIANLLWCHQNLRFKEGVYHVRHQSADHLVIERGGRALIGINDQWTAWQNNTVNCDFANGTVLKDYSGANGAATVTVSNGQVSINTPPCDGSALLGRRGYSVWAPQNISQNYNLTPRTTTQEWEMADDLGDSHPLSLRQGGAVPDNSTAWRTAGRVFVAAGQPITYVVTPTDATRPLVLAVLDPNVNARQPADSVLGTGVLTKTYTPATGGYKTLLIRNRVNPQPGQRAYVKVTYMAPQVLLVNAVGLPDDHATPDPAARLTVWPNPAASGAALHLMIDAGRPRAATVRVFDVLGREVARQAVRLGAGPNDVALPAAATLRPGLYLVRVPELNLTTRVLIGAGGGAE